ncbi:MAG TPA: cupin domain-containing protein [Agriterribacter sp.]|nr:cupin domain-containing protein [Chitinophagaceae bacterium]HRP31374.1 cupin domain-containing protein [Agriterribacter sp.]
MATFEKETVFNLEEMIEYTEGGVISKQITKCKGGNLTLFSFDKEQGLSEHKTPFDAIVQILDGKAEVTINAKVHHLKKGDCIIMPADIPHALKAIERFKMLLTMIKQE